MSDGQWPQHRAPGLLKMAFHSRSTLQGTVCGCQFCTQPRTYQVRPYVARLVVQAEEACQGIFQAVVDPVPALRSRS